MTDYMGAEGKELVGWMDMQVEDKHTETKLVALLAMQQQVCMQWPQSVRYGSHVLVVVLCN